MTNKIFEILIVEDSLTQAEGLKYVLEEHNYLVRHALNGQKALEILGQSETDIIISDVIMPGMDGYSFCATVKADDRLKKIPVILLTSLSDPSDVMRGLECGADSFLVKPYNEAILIARIHYFMKNSEFRKVQTDNSGLEVLFSNLQYTINSSRQQILDILLSTYENSILKNEELKESNKSLKIAQDKLSHLNASLEQQVKNRTQELENSKEILVDEIKGRKSAQEKLMESDVRYKKAQEIGQVGSWEYNIENNTFWGSDEGKKIYGFNLTTDIFTADEVMKCVIERDRVDKALIDLIQNNIPYDIEFEIIPLNSTERKTIHSKAEILRDAKGDPTNISGVMHDITERKQAELELIATKEKAEESNRLKSALLNNMSHEIRTPMNAIMGFSDLMKEADPDEKDCYAEIINNSSNELLSLIDNVILLSRLQSEKLPIHITAVKPATLINQIIQTHSHPDLNKGVEIKENIPGQHNNFVILTDEGKVLQILTILTSNAVNYTFAGSVEIGCLFGKEYIEFYVEDTGIGIPEDEKDQIFETFYRSKKAISLAIRGCGLGLGIAKELASLVGGTICLTSVLNKGSRFCLKIPLEISDQGQSLLSKPQIAKKDISEFSILIAEDEPINVKYLDIILKGMVKKLTFAENGKIAVELASKNRYNLVLMDIKMPLMGGIEATKILKASYPDLPIVAQTAYTSHEDKDLALQAGCDFFLSKPIRKTELIEAIMNYGQSLHA